jgi:hypothetical protein
VVAVSGNRLRFRGRLSASEESLRNALVGSPCRREKFKAELRNLIYLAWTSLPKMTFILQMPAIFDRRPVGMWHVQNARGVGWWRTDHVAYVGRGLDLAVRLALPFNACHGAVGRFRWCVAQRLALLLIERVRPHAARTLSITEYLAYYDAGRLHFSLLGYVSPSEFERFWRAGNQRKEEPVSQRMSSYPPPADVAVVTGDPPTGRG